MSTRIDFMIAGAQKCGTTSLHALLGQHPGVFMPAVKEMQYFSNAEFFARGERYLQPFYRDRVQGQLVGGADVNVMVVEASLERMQAHNAGMKVIAVLRNPVRRAYSAFCFERQKLLEEEPDFLQAIDKDRDSGRFGYLQRGRYAEQIRRLQRYFGPAGVYCVLTSDLADDPAGVSERLWAFLGLPEAPPGQLERRKNVTGAPRFKTLQKFLYHDNFVKRMWRHVPASVRYKVRERLLVPMVALNSKKVAIPSMTESEAAFLIDYYREDIVATGELLDRDLNDWLAPEAILEVPADAAGAGGQGR